jgi:hypothetical protein
MQEPRKNYENSNELSALEPTLTLFNANDTHFNLHQFNELSLSIQESELRLRYSF